MKTRRFLSILLVVAFSVSTWALDKDADGYYLIGSVQDWKDFAALVNNGTEPTAKARMVADINLGDDQTRIGDTREVEDGYFFKGVFDGQGHTLTIAYNVTDTQTTSDPQAPFTHIKGATIKNLHVDGIVATSHAHSAIVAWVRGGTNVISNVWSSLKTTTSRSGWDECSAIVSWIGHATVTIQDCLFTGSITGTNGTSYNGCFIGWCQHGDDNTQVLNCLSTGTFTNIGDCDPTRGRTHTNSYIKQFPTSIPADMQVTDDNLANGTTTAALNSNRTGDDAPWIQDPVTHQPMLKMFASLKQDAEGYYLIGSVKDWDNFAALVQKTPATYNAKLTADVNLGTDQTMLGSIEQPYSGTFDGQGFSLTVQLNSTLDGVAPFRRIDNTTIKNLAVAGTITGGIHCSGLVGGVPENSEYNLISNVMVSATITTTGSHCGGILGHGGSTLNTTIQDCLFNGTINGRDGGSTVGVIWGWQTYGKANITSCLENGTYTNCSSFDPVFMAYSAGAVINSTYYVTGNSTNGTQATTTTLSDGTVTSGLNNGRTGDEAPWIQDPVTNLPMLKSFVSKNSGISTGFIPIENGKLEMENEANGWYSISGQKHNGKPAEKGIYIRNGKKIIVK